MPIVKKSMFGDVGTLPTAVPTLKPPAAAAPPQMAAPKKSQFGDLAAAPAPPPVVIPESSPAYGLAVPGTTTQVGIDQAAAGPKEDLGGAAAAGVGKALTGIANLPSFIIGGSLNVGPIAKNVATGRPWNENLPNDVSRIQHDISKILTDNGVPDPHAQIANTFLEKLVMSSTEAGTGVAAPELVIPKLLNALKDIGIIGQRAVEIVTAMTGEGSSLKQVAKDAVIGGGFGAGQTAVNEIPDQYLPGVLKPIASMVGGVLGGVATHTAMATPGVVLRGGAKAAQTILAPFTEGGREAIVGKKLTAGATDAEASIRALETPAAGDGFKPTTAQKAGDMGLLDTERKAAVSDPVPFNERRGEQNAARLDATKSIQPVGSAEGVIPVLRNHLAAIDEAAAREVAATAAGADARNSTTQAAGEAGVTAARQTGDLAASSAASAARRDVAAIGDAIEPDQAGAGMRGGYEGARSAAKTAERRVWDAVDPEKKLALDTNHTTSEVARIRSEISPNSAPPAGEEGRLFDVAARQRPVERLVDIQALQADVKAQMRAEVKLNGETPSFRRLTQLNNALQKDLETGVADVAAHEQRAVEAGTMHPAETMLSRLAKERDDFFANRDQIQARATGGGDLGYDAGAGPTPVRGASRAEGTPNNGPRVGTGPQGLAADELTANLTPEALDRLTAARSATRQRVETFDNPTMQPLRERNSARVGDSSVPGRIFHPGAKSFDDVTTFRAAVGDGEAMRSLEGFAVDRLHRAAVRDGVLNPKLAETWLRNHSDALRAFPELEARVRRSVSSAEHVARTGEEGAARVKAAETKAKDDAKAAETTGKQEVSAAEKKAKETTSEARSGTVGKVAEADGPEEVVNHVGKAFSRADSAREMARLRAATKGDKVAQQSLRKAVIDHIIKKFVSNAEVGTSGETAIKSDAFQTFVREQEHALRAAGFSDAEIHTLKEVAASLRQANRSIIAVKLPGSPNTATDLIGAAKGPGRAMLQFLAVSLSAAGGGEVLHAPSGWGLTLGAMAAVATLVRSYGVRKIDELLKEALLDPALAARLMKKVRPAEARAEVKGFMEALRPGNVARSVAGAVGDAGGGAKKLGSTIGSFLKSDSGEGHIGTGTRKVKSADLLRSVDELATMADEQKSWKDWYDRHEQVIQELFGHDSEVFAEVLSATSQANTVHGNVTLALKAFEQLKSGAPFKGYLPAVIKNLERIRADTELKGQKIGQFGEANAGNGDAIAVDRHISMLMFDEVSPSAKQTAAAKVAIREIAAKMGWKPREVQAALWAANQVRMGKDPLKVVSYDTILLNKAAAIDKLAERFQSREANPQGPGGGAAAGGEAAAGAEGPQAEAALKAKLKGEGATAVKVGPVHRLVSDDRIPKITLQDMVGIKVFPTIADRTAAGAVFNGIDGSGLNVDIPMLGGPYFPLSENNVKAGVAWANRGASVVTQKGAKMEDGATHMLVVVGDANMHQSNTTVTDAFFSTLDAYVRDGRLTGTSADELAAKVRAASSSDPAVLKQLQAFPGMQDAAKLKEYMHSVSFETRKRLLDVLGSKSARDLGAPSMTRILDATREPSLAGHRWGDGVLLVKLNTDSPMVKLGEEGTQPHPDFPLGIRGEVVGRFDKPVNYEMLWGGYLDATKARGQAAYDAKLAAGEKASPPNARRAFELAKPVVKVTQKLVDSIGPIENGAIDSAQQAKLATSMATSDWKRSGGAVKDGGASPADFVNAIRDSEAAATLSHYTLDEVKAGIKDGSWEVNQLKGGEIYYALKKGDPGYAADYGVDIPEIGKNEVTLVSVINNEQGAKGIGGPAIILDALSRGATVLDCFGVKTAKYPDGFLPELYKAFGFKKVGEVPFDPSYFDKNKMADLEHYWKKSGWSKEENGHPPLVIMKWMGSNADRKGITSKYLRDGLEGLLAGGADEDVRAFSAEFGGAAEAPAGKAGPSANPGRAAGHQGAGAGASLTSRARAVVDSITKLSDNELKNLGLTPGDRSRVQAAVVAPPRV